MFHYELFFCTIHMNRGVFIAWLHKSQIEIQAGREMSVSLFNKLIVFELCVISIILIVMTFCAVVFDSR